jgi:hypothetical protein
MGSWEIHFYSGRTTSQTPACRPMIKVIPFPKRKGTAMRCNEKPMVQRFDAVLHQRLPQIHIHSPTIDAIAHTVLLRYRLSTDENKCARVRKLKL